MLFLIIALLIALVVLMIYKKKPFKLYLAIIIYYSLIFISLFYLSSVLRGFEDELLVSTSARSIRDILTIVYIPQYIFIVFMILRTIGFDLKKFNFKNDIKDLKLSRKDEEEIEININFELYKVKRGAHRVFRELIYYVRENLFIFICVLVAISGLLFHFVRVNFFTSYDKTYTMGKSFYYNNMEVSISDAMVTNLDYQGNKLDNYYLVLKTNLRNNNNYTIDVDVNAFKLEVGGELINPDIINSNYFSDFCPSLNSNYFGTNVSRTFALVYKIDSKYINKNKQLVLQNGTIYSNKKYIDKHIYVKLKAKVYTSVDIVSNYNVGDTISFKDSLVGDSSFKINSYSLNNSFKYSYDVCDENNKCKTYDDLITVKVKNRNEKYILLVMDGLFFLDSSTSYSNSFSSISSFTKNFMKIQYRLNGEIYQNKEYNITSSYSNKYIIFEVPASIEGADIIQAIITIRNKQYIVNLRK